MEVSPELRLTPRSSGQLLWPDYLVPIDGRWPIHALPRTPLSRLVRPAQRAVAQRLRALAQGGDAGRRPSRRPILWGATVAVILLWPTVGPTQASSWPLSRPVSEQVLPCCREARWLRLTDSVEKEF